MRYLYAFAIWLCCTHSSLADDTGRSTDLAEVLVFAQRTASQIDRNVRDYTCILMKQERIEGRLRHWECMRAKIRHGDRETGVPFSVYLRFLKPESVVDREVLYVHGGDLIARNGGSRQPNLTLHLSPTGSLAMERSRYPITEVGFMTLATRLIEVLQHEQARGTAKLFVYNKATMDGRNCTHFRLIQTRKAPGLPYFSAEVSVDKQLGIPIFYRAYDWPKREGEKPILLEQYYYRDIKINVGLTDQDFDPKNPSYGFQVKELLSDRKKHSDTNDTR